MFQFFSEKKRNLNGQFLCFDQLNKLFKPFDFYDLNNNDEASFVSHLYILLTQ
jgi:hypothetical protein